MDLGSAFGVSASGLHAQRTRLDVIASNLANANSSQSEAGGAYKRRDVVLVAEPVAGSFENSLADAHGSSMGVRVARIVEDDRPPRMVLDPGHPHANEDGYVALPNIEVMSEMVDLMAATRAYEANVSAVQATKRVLQAALEIGQTR